MTQDPDDLNAPPTPSAQPETAQPISKQNAGCARTILIVAGISLLLCVVLGIIAILTGGNKTTAQPTAPAAVAPVTTIEPAPTPTAPTATAQPQPTSDVSAAEASYLLSMEEITTDLGQAFSGLGEHTVAVSDDPTLLVDNDWKIKAGIYLGIIRGVCQRIHDLTPPPRFAAMHAELLTAADHYEKACILYAAGVDELSLTKLNQSDQEINQGNVAFQSATILANQLASGTPTASASTQPSISAKGPTVKSAANLRSGPGATYTKTGSAPVGQALNIISRNPAGDWYQLASGAWIAAFLVANPPAGIPVVTVSPPTPAAAAPSKAVAIPVRAAPTVPVAKKITPLPTKTPQRAAPTVAAPSALTANQGYACAKCIKGNINSKGEHIYHYPGCQSYKATIIDEGKGERWFSSETEAVAAGWRVALNCR